MTELRDPVHGRGAVLRAPFRLPTDGLIDNMPGAIDNTPIDDTPGALENVVDGEIQLLDAVPCALAAVDDDGVVAVWNPAAEALFGWTAAEAVGRRLADVVTTPDGEDLLAPGSPRHGPPPGGPGPVTAGSAVAERRWLRVRRRDGHEFVAEIEIGVGVSRSGTGRAGRLRCLLVRDATEAQVAERLRGCVTEVADVLGRSGTLSEVAAEALERIGRTVGSSSAELWLLDPVSGTERLTERWRGPAASPSVPPVPAGLPGDATVLSAPLVIGDETLGRLVVRDCAGGGARRAFLHCLGAQFAQFLGRLRAEQVGLELARTKDEFIALAGHTLRTPLTTIVSLTDLLLDCGDDLADERDALLVRVKANADVLRGIVEDLLDLAGLESGHINLSIGPLDLAQLVAAAVAAVAPAAAATGVRVEADLPAELPTQGDRVRLRQAVDNLLSNAVKYSPDGGTVRVRLTVADAVAELTVADEGLGVPEAERDRLFSRFFRGATTHEHGIPGTGLGLPLIRLIAELHGGTIALIDGTVDAAHTGPARPVRPGATFTLRLPLAGRGA